MSIEKIDFELFPSLVSLYKNVLSQEQLNSIYEFLLDEQEKSNMEFGREITLSGKSSFVNRETDILRKISKEIPSCHDLFDIVSHIICDYGKSYGMDYLEIETSWFNIQPVGDILREHSHGFSPISSSLFIHVDDDSSNIVFQNPNPVVKSNYYTNERIESKYAFDNYWIKPSPGDLVVFPGWLIHGSNYQVNNTVNRTIIGCNAVREKD